MTISEFKKSDLTSMVGMSCVDKTLADKELNEINKMHNYLENPQNYKIARDKRE